MLISRFFQAPMSQGEFIFVLIAVLLLLVGLAGILVSQIGKRKISDDAFPQLQHTIAIPGVATWSIELATGVLTTSAAFAEMLGLDPAADTLDHLLHAQLCHPEDRAGYHAAIAARAGEFEYRIRHARGHYLWIHCRSGVVQGKAQGASRLAGAAIDITLRRNADLELLRVHESLRLAMEASQAGHFDIEMRSDAAYWSPRALEILGRAAALPITTAILPTLVHPDDLTEFLAEREDFRMSGRPLDMELRLRHEAGHYIWVHMRATVQGSGSGPAGRVIGLIRDISQRRSAEQARVSGEKKYRDLIEGSIQAILIIDRDVPVFCNRACAQMFGYDSPQNMLMGGSILPHFMPELKATFDQLWESLMRGDNDGIVRRRKLLDRQGRPFEVELVGRRIQWDGKSAWQATMFDITQRSRFEQELRESEERFRLLADNSSDVIIVYDSAGIVSYVSPSVERVSGYSAAEIVGRTGFELMHPDDVPAVKRRRENIRNGTQDASGVLRWRAIHRDGGVRWIETTNAILPSKNGGPPELVSASREITERVERENELSAAHQRLEIQAKDLADLAQSLEAERERAEQANAAKSQFLAMMSHELRTPMTGVLGMADLLRLTKLDEEQRDLTLQLTRSARMLLDLLNDILDFSKVEAGQLQIESTPFRLSDIVADVHNLFVSTAVEKRVILHSNLPVDYCDNVVGDPKRTRQVLANLVNNAIKFTEKGSICVAMSQTRTADDLTVSFAVTDSGIGIAPEDIARLFAPFIQADISTSRKFGGTGLGLAICKRLVEAMGGAIEVTSVPGQGSCFKFSVRVHRASAEEAQRHSSDARRYENAPLQVVPRRILLAEDNETSRFLIATMLRRRGHSVEAVTDGLKACEAVMTGPFDIVLMDMQMPVMDGPEATREIRKLSGPRGSIPIIALTADVIADHRKIYLQAGVNAVVGKPVNWVELEHEIGRQLTGGAALGEKIQLPEPASAPRGGELVDDAALAALGDALGNDILATMLASCAANISQYAHDLHVAVAAGYFEKSQRAAHALKGLCAQFGAPRVAALARFVENHLRSLDEILPLMPEIEETVAATTVAFTARRLALISPPSAKAG